MGATAAAAPTHGAALSAQIVARRAAMASTEQEVVDETVQWLHVAQRAVQYLADRFGVSLETALEELRLDPDAVLYSKADGDFLSE